MDADFNIIGEFNEFIRPPDTAVWDEHATRVHGYHRSHESIVSAKSIVEVWARFKSTVESYTTKPNTVGMMLAWNGKASDCSKLFELTEVEYRGTLFMPDGVLYFADPMIAINGYKRNVLNESKSLTGTPLGYGLGVIYEIMFDEPLAGAHNSLVDAKAQAKIFADARVQSTFDLSKVVVLMEDVWSGKKKREYELASEPTRAVPFGWDDEGTEQNVIPERMQYFGSAGGGWRNCWSILTAC